MEAKWLNFPGPHHWVHRAAHDRLFFFIFVSLNGTFGHYKKVSNELQTSLCRCHFNGMGKRHFELKASCDGCRKCNPIERMADSATMRPRFTRLEHLHMIDWMLSVVMLIDRGLLNLLAGQEGRLIMVAISNNISYI